MSKSIIFSIAMLLSLYLQSGSAKTVSALSIEDSFPDLKYVDTTTPGGSTFEQDWTISSTLGNNDFAVEYWLQNSMRTPLSIPLGTNSRASLVVNSAGDLHLADQAVSIDRSAAFLGIGTALPTAELDIRSPQPLIELRRETDNSAAFIRYDAELLLLQGRQQQNTISISSSAPDHALRINAAGAIGLGTIAPSKALEISSSTPRLKFNNSDSHSADFSIGEFINDFTLAITANPVGGPSGTALTIDAASGSLGFHQTAPEATTTVHSPNADDAKVLIENTITSATARTLFELRNSGNTKFTLSNTDPNYANQWAFANPGTSFRVSLQNSGKVELEVNNDGNMTISGVLKENSDRDTKTRITPLDYPDLLTRLNKLPIYQWRYSDTPDEYHIGPMAQDFYAAFGLGGSDTSIATMDLTATALAGVQALAEAQQKARQQQAVIRQQQSSLQQQLTRAETEICKLQSTIQQLDRLEQAVYQLTQPGSTWVVLQAE